MAATLCNLLASTSVPTAEYSVVGSSAKLVKYVKNNISAAVAPGVNDDNTQGYAIFSVWIDTTNDNIYQCVDASTGAAVWKQLDGGAGSVDASVVTYTPADDTDWTGATDPGDVDNALDQLADRTKAIEANGWVTYARIQDMPACSVLGRSANSTGVPADIPSSTDNEILVRRSGSLGFGTLVAGDIPSHASTHEAGGSDPVDPNISDLTQGRISDPSADFLPAHDTSIGSVYKWTPDMLYPKGYHFGLTLSNNGTDPTNDIDIAAGVARDSTDVTTLRTTGLTKRLDASWAVGSGNGGRDTGAIANDVYHVWLIMRSDTGVVDALFSASATSPTMPANYDYKRRIGSIIRSSGAILLFTQVAHHFVLSTNVMDVDVTNLGSASRTLYTLTVPDGIKVWADIRIVAPTSGENSYITSPDQADESNSGMNARQAVSGSVSAIQERMVRTNTSAQIGARANAANTDVRISTFGWWDFMEDA